MDKLEDIVKQQKMFMSRLNVIDFSADLLKAQQETKDLLFAICCELGEVGDEINWKPWKKTMKTIDLKNIRIELIDIFHFVIELMIIWGMDADLIHKVYCEKMIENNKRQDNNY